MITVEDMVRREVHYCVSYLVSTLAGGDSSENRGDLADMMEQALELACPIVDWEEAAREAIQDWDAEDCAAELTERAFEFDPNDSTKMLRSTLANVVCNDAYDAQQFCESNDIDPYEWEVYEHWIVSDWLADQLAARGEKVNKDFAGLTVWARTTTGQAISLDGVIVAIHASLAGESV